MDRLAFTRLVEEPLHRFLERADVLAVIAADDIRALSDEPGEGASELRDLLILRRFEELPREVLVGRRAVLGLVNRHARRMTVDRFADIDDIGASSVVQGIQPPIEFLGPGTQRVGAIEIGRCHFRHVDQLFEQPLVVPP